MCAHCAHCKYPLTLIVITNLISASTNDHVSLISAVFVCVSVSGYIFLRRGYYKSCKIKHLKKIQPKREAIAFFSYSGFLFKLL